MRVVVLAQALLAVRRLCPAVQVGAVLVVVPAIMVEQREPQIQVAAAAVLVLLQIVRAAMAAQAS
jgi:hypothetical protein